MPAVPELRVYRENGRYKQGETITFTAKGLTKKKASYRLEIDNDELISQGVIPASGKISVKAPRPCFLNMKIDMGSDVPPLEAAAAVSPEKISPSMPKPDDFDKFWRGKLAALSRVPANLKIEQIPPPSQYALEDWREKWPYFGDYPKKTSDIDVFMFEAAALTGNPARGYMAMPKASPKGSLPALLTTHGSGVRDSDLPKICAAAERGFIAVDINAHGLLNGQPASYYRGVSDTYAGFFKSGHCFQRGKYDRETLYFVEMFLRHKRALDILCSQKQWDGKNLIVRGESQGGALALACAGLDKRVTTVCAGVPALVDATFAYPLKNWFEIHKETPENAEKIRETMRYASLCNFADKMTAAACFSAAYIDRACHPATIYAGYNLYAGPKKMFDAPRANHGGVPNPIHYQAFTEFMLGNLR